MQEAIDV